MPVEAVDKGTETRVDVTQIEPEDFSGAFDAAEKETSVQKEIPEAGLTGKTGEPPAKVQEEADKAASHGTSGDADTTQAKSVDDGKASTAGETPSSTDPKTGKEAEATYEQRWKTLDGLVKNAQERFNAKEAQLLERIDALQKKLDELSSTDNKKGATKKDAVDEDDLTADQKKALDEYEHDFDVVSKMEGLKRQREIKALRKEIQSQYDQKIKELIDQFTSKMEPIAASVDSSANEKHYSTIAGRFPDYEQHVESGAIMKWIESKPKYMQASMKLIYEKGNTDNAIELLGDFYRENNLTKTKEPTAEEKAQQEAIEKEKQAAERAKEAKKKNLTAVVGKHGAVNLAVASKDDFDTAFDEAASK